MMQDVKQRVALSSIAASAGLTVAKAVVGVMSGSLALLSEAAHSLIDFGATVMTYFAVRASPQTPNTITATARSRASPRSLRRRCYSLSPAS
jgi:divalent metal cation (Fe/Co/Zn/Cd) transporter